VRLLHFQQGEVMSTSTPVAVRSLPTVQRSDSGCMPPPRSSATAPNSSPPARAENDPLALPSPALPPHPELLHEWMPPPTTRSSRIRTSAHGNNGKGKNNDDAGGFGNRDCRGRDSGRGRTQTPIEHEPATD
jgi:hypothetical protein